MLQCRGVFILRNLAETGYNSAVASKSDTYFPEVQLEGDPNSKTDTPEQQGITDPPDISIAEGGGESAQDLEFFFAVGAGKTEVDQFAADSQDALGEVPVTADEFPALENIGDVNKERTTDDKAQAEMGQYEVQDQLNGTEKYDISEIYILSHYFKPSNGTLMVKVIGCIQQVMIL